MECDELRDQFESIALGPPDEWPDHRMLEHLQSCSNCQRELREYQDAWLLLSAATPRAAVSESFEARVMDRVSRVRPASRNYSRNAVVLKYALAAGVMFLLVGLTFLRLGLFGFGPEMSDTEIDQIRSIATQMEKMDELEDAFASPQITYVSLTSNQARRPSGYLVHDPMSRQVHFFGTNLTRLERNDSVLRVWLLNQEEEVLCSATIELAQGNNSLGSALMTLARPAAAKSALITIESDTDEPSVPSEDVILRSEVSDL